MRYDRVMGTEASIAADLAKVVAAIRETNADPRIGWAWLEAEYRASPARAFQGQSAALTVEDHGMPALEKAMDALLTDQRVRAFGKRRTYGPPSCPFWRRPQPTARSTLRLQSGNY